MGYYVGKAGGLVRLNYVGDGLRRLPDHAPADEAGVGRTRGDRRSFALKMLSVTGTDFLAVFGAMRSRGLRIAVSVALKVCFTGPLNNLCNNSAFA